MRVLSILMLVLTSLLLLRSRFRSSIISILGDVYLSVVTFPSPRLRLRLVAALLLMLLLVSMFRLRVCPMSMVSPLCAVCMSIP